LLDRRRTPRACARRLTRGHPQAGFPVARTHRLRTTTVVPTWAGLARGRGSAHRPVETLLRPGTRALPGRSGDGAHHLLACNREQSAGDRGGGGLTRIEGQSVQVAAARPRDLAATIVDFAPPCSLGQA